MVQKLSCIFIPHLYNTLVKIVNKNKKHDLGALLIVQDVR